MNRRPGELQLRRAIRRLQLRSARALAEAGQSARRHLAPRPPIDPPEPASDWERHTDERLSAIERTVTNQNRLLLLTLVSIVGDTVYSMVRK